MLVHAVGLQPRPASARGVGPGHENYIVGRGHESYWTGEIDGENGSLRFDLELSVPFVFFNY